VADGAVALVRPRRIGRVHWRGLGALYVREGLRALKLWPITLVGAPLRVLLFAGVFALVAQDAPDMAGLPFMQFLAAGLVASAVLEKAFEATAFSILVDRIEGIIRDVLMPPLAGFELLAAYLLAATSGGVAMGLLVYGLLLPFGLSWPQHPFAALGFAALGACLVGQFGMLAALWADKWDKMSMVQTFVFTPVLFLSGVFYSVERLPTFAQVLSHANPLFYVIDGVRYGLLGRGEADPRLGAIVIGASVLVLGALCLRLLAIGYKLRP
jgi:ABC-2 type transport system permease protein